MVPVSPVLAGGGPHPAGGADGVPAAPEGAGAAAGFAAGLPVRVLRLVPFVLGPVGREGDVPLPGPCSLGGMAVPFSL